MTKKLLNKFTNIKNIPLSAHRNLKENEERLINLCSIGIQDALEELQTNIQGLNSKEAESRLDEIGPNELSHLKKLGFWADIANRMKGPLVIQLLVIAIVSAVIGEIKSTIIVVAMILLSVGLSYVFDRRSNRAVEALGKRVQSRAFVIRDDK